MSLLEKIAALIEEEVERKVNYKLNQYIEKISKIYGISKQTLLKDSDGIDVVDHRCKGFKANGQRCKHNGKHDGYCRWHKPKVPPKPEVKKLNILEHNHTVPPLFQAGCPACEKSKIVPKKLLIEI